MKSVIIATAKPIMAKYNASEGKNGNQIHVIRKANEAIVIIPVHLVISNRVQNVSKVTTTTINNVVKPAAV